MLPGHACVLLLNALACCIRWSAPGMLSMSSAYIANPASVNTHNAIANVSTFNIMCGSVWDVIKLVTESRFEALNTAVTIDS
jgi:hypothetical protein